MKTKIRLKRGLNIRLFWCWLLSGHMSVECADGAKRAGFRIGGCHLVK